MVSLLENSGGSRIHSLDCAFDVSLAGNSHAFPGGGWWICAKAGFTPRLITSETASNSRNIYDAKNPHCFILFSSELIHLFGSAVYIQSTAEMIWKQIITLKKLSIPNKFIHS